MRIIASAVMTLMLALAAPVAADDTFAFPDTPAGRVAAAFFDSFNSGDEERVRAFTLEHRSPSALAERTMDERLAIYRQLRGMLGDIEPRGLLAEAPYAITIHAHAPQMGGWLQLAFALDANPPHKLDNIAVQPAPDPTAFDVSYEGWTDLGDLVDRVRADLKVPALTVAVADASGVVHRAARGVRRIDRDDPVQIDDRFHIGSITKSMTATIIGRLIERGLLTWDTTLATALPDVAMRDEYRDVTLALLLRHRAGIQPHQNFDGPEMSRLVGLPGTPVEQRGAYVAEVLMASPIAPPGSAQHYSNAGYAVAGHIAERVAGVPWESLMRSEVFVPCAMETSGIGWPATPERPNQPHGHALDGDRPHVQTLDEYDLGSFLGPAGNVNCSAADLARYGRMHLLGLQGKDGPLKAATIGTLHVPDDPASNQPYACGWVVREQDDGRSIHWHNGSAGTFYATLTIFPKEGIVVAALMNRAAVSADLVLEKMCKAILEGVTPGAER